VLQDRGRGIPNVVRFRHCLRPNVETADSVLRPAGVLALFAAVMASRSATP